MDNILVEKRDHTAILTINHPPVNTWDLATMDAFEQAVNRVEKDDDIRVVVITGSGDKCFSAGFDIKDAGNAVKISSKGRELWTRIDCFAKPVIAAINGHAVGGGLELALSCHFRFMVDDPGVSTGLPELDRGIIPGWGGTQRLMQVVGKAKALDMILFSKTIAPRQALEIGLVNQLFAPESLMQDTLAFARRLAQRPPIAVSCTLKAISAGIYEGQQRGLEVEQEGSNIVRATEDCREGFLAFLEKRKPVFQGR
jgi:enoyl-CoA hydratase/carnithine racemase